MKKNQTVTATEEKKPAKWVFSKAKKIDAFERMLEKAWADSGLQDEPIKKKVHDILAKWYKLDSTSPFAGYSGHCRPQSQEELEKQMCEDFAMQFSQYNGYLEKDIEQIWKELEMEQIVKDENLKKAEWEYFEDETDYSPYAEATTTIDGKTVTVGYLWDEQLEWCYVRINGADVRDRGVCEHCCEVVEHTIGKRLTGLSYELWESWVEYHGLHEDWEDMDLNNRVNWLCDELGNTTGTVRRRYVCTIEIWVEALGQKRAQFDRYKGKEIREIMAKMDGWVARGNKKRTFVHYGRQRYFERVE